MDIPKDDITSLIAEIRLMREDINRNNRDFTHALNQYSEIVEKNTKLIEENSKNIKTLIERMDEITTHQKTFATKLNEIDAFNNNLEQKLLSNVIEIAGVPFQRNENVIELAKNVFKKIGHEVDSILIDDVYRTRGNPMTKTPGVIVVSLLRRIDKNIIMEKYKKERRQISNRDLGFLDGEGSNIYVNNRLTYNNKKLLRDAKLVQREKNLKYVWFNKNYQLCSFTVKAIKLYNNLPEIVKTTTTAAVFKKRLKDYLLNKNDY
ncbi:uncharacterized protein LOC116162422 [Photinus pyralis]|uniref:uncharacterized protein LOC116162422 n=1 Tax=Photinus pyralis TaxID=7054 RepID=UPI0012675BCA|nr:uncharacterized protein LOC116162422 [Photinus pyralis]